MLHIIIIGYFSRCHLGDFGVVVAVRVEANVLIGHFGRSSQLETMRNEQSSRNPINFRYIESERRADELVAASRKFIGFESGASFIASSILHLALRKTKTKTLIDFRRHSRRYCVFVGRLADGGACQPCDRNQNHNNQLGDTNSLSARD